MLHGGEIYDKEIEYDFSVNLNPSGCPLEVKTAMEEAVSLAGFYPDIKQEIIRQKIAEVENSKSFTVSPSMVVCGNGASELILAIVNLLKPGKVLLPVPSFYGYKHALNSLTDSYNKKCNDLAGEVIEEYVLKEEDNFTLTDEFIKAITPEHDLVIIADPNNPTGRLIDERLLKGIIDRCNETGTAIIVDECFLRLSTGGVSAVKYLKDNRKLFIVNAFTKLFSIPGVRIGYAISDAENIQKLIRHLPEWNLSVFAEKAGIACCDILLGTDFHKESLQLIESERENLTKGLERKGIRVFPSDTNFLLISSDLNLYEILLQKGIFIRDCSGFEGLRKGFYRIAVSNPEANRILLDVLLG